MLDSRQTSSSVIEESSRGTCLLPVSAFFYFELVLKLVQQKLCGFDDVLSIQLFGKYQRDESIGTDDNFPSPFVRYLSRKDDSIFIVQRSLILGQLPRLAVGYSSTLFPPFSYKAFSRHTPNPTITSDIYRYLEF
jgi:hypothetical protein